MLTRNYKLLEAIGLVLIIVSWSLGFWGVNKYSTESSKLADDFQEQTQYYQHMINLLATKLDVEVAKTDNIEKSQKKTIEERVELTKKIWHRRLYAL